MLRTLLESRAPSRPPRRRVATIASVIAHSTLLIVLVRAGAGGTREITAEEVTDLVYFVPAAETPARQEHVRTATTVASQTALPIIAVIPEMTPHFDVTDRLAAALPEFRASARVGEILPAVNDSGRQALLTERTVDQPVVLLAGQQPPTYPTALERAGISGDVVAQFVVDTTGRVERGSVDIQQATHAAFARVVQERLMVLRFLPARVDGRPVRQLVQQQFRFEVVRR